MRWVIVGAGAVGGVVAGYLAGAGQDVAVVARGAHLEAIRARGLAVRSPDGERTFRLPAAADPGEVDWRPGDVAVLAVKSMDTEEVLRSIAAHASEDTPVVCLQNGVANERGRAAPLRERVRHLRDVPAEPSGARRRAGTPRAGRPASSTSAGIRPASTTPRRRWRPAFASAASHSVARPDVMRWKYRKLLMNLGNAVEALCGRVDAAEVARTARGRGRGGAAPRRASTFATEAEDAERRGDIMTHAAESTASAAAAARRGRASPGAPARSRPTT